VIAEGEPEGEAAQEIDIPGCGGRRGLQKNDDREERLQAIDLGDERLGPGERGEGEGKGRDKCRVEGEPLPRSNRKPFGLSR